jgi:hypothetical protein
MNPRIPILLLSLPLWCAVGSAAFANAGIPALVTGTLPFSGLIALPATVLVAFVERPFVTAAGVKRHALWFSLQANLFSLLLGYGILFLALDTISRNMGYWILIAIGLSIVAEAFYYQLVAADADRPINWWMIAFGNMASNLALFFVEALAATGRYAPLVAWWERGGWYQRFAWTVAGASAAVFLASFLIPVCRRRVKGP